MLLHVESLDKPPRKKEHQFKSSPWLVIAAYLPVTVGALVRLLPRVDLPVPVEAAGVGQHLPALLAPDHRLPVGADLPSPDAAIRMFLSLYL